MLECAYMASAMRFWWHRENMRSCLFHSFPQDTIIYDHHVSPSSRSLTITCTEFLEDSILLTQKQKNTEA